MSTVGGWVRRTNREAIAAAGIATAAQAGRSRHSIRAFDVLLALAGVALTFVWAAGIVIPDSESGRTSDTDAWWAWASLIGFAAGSIIHTPVHELGHLLAATALRLPVVTVRVWHIRFGRPDPALVGTSGHVAVELVDAMRWLPMRMIAFSLAGPAANVAVAMATATTVVENPSATTGLRTMAVGITVAGLCGAFANLAPRRPTRDYETDGLSALQWIFRTDHARARVGIQTTEARQLVTPMPGGTKTLQQRRDNLLSEIENDHPDIAVAAMTELLRRRPRWDDGWQDVDVVATFAARDDLPADVRAQVSSQYSLSLALAYLVSLGPYEATDPDSPKVRRMEELAELGLAAKPESLQPRTAVALVRVIQERSADARALLIDVASSASPAVQARAYAVGGIAEIKLGDLNRARELGRVARRLAPDDSLVKLLHVFLASKGPL